MSLKRIIGPVITPNGGGRNPGVGFGGGKFAAKNADGSVNIITIISTISANLRDTGLIFISFMGLMFDFEGLTATNSIGENRLKVNIRL